MQGRLLLTYQCARHKQAHTVVNLASLLSLAQHLLLGLHSNVACEDLLCQRQAESLSLLLLLLLLCKTQSSGQTMLLPSKAASVCLLQASQMARRAFCTRL
jgi:hypothetical protein